MVEASRHEAVLAVDLYNRPRQPRTLEAFFLHMHVAWLYLLHAEFRQANVDYRYYDSEGRLVRVDGEPKTWELQKCVEQRWAPPDPVRLNLEATISIRNRIEHRWQRELMIATAGFAQSLVLNFEEELCSHFSPSYSLEDELRFPLFIGAFTPNGVDRMLKAQQRLPLRLRRFLATFHADLDDSARSDQRYEFRVHLIPRTGAKTEADVSMSFVREETLTDEQRKALIALGEAGTVIVRERVRPVANAGLMRPAEAARRINERLPYRFGLYSHFSHLWKHMAVRPLSGVEHPERTDERYCVYDAAHGDYLYTPAFVEKAVELLASEEHWLTVFGRPAVPAD